MTLHGERAGRQSTVTGEPNDDLIGRHLMSIRMHKTLLVLLTHITIVSTIIIAIIMLMQHDAVQLPADQLRREQTTDLPAAL